MAVQFDIQQVHPVEKVLMWHHDTFSWPNEPIQVNKHNPWFFFWGGDGQTHCEESSVIRNDIYTWYWKVMVNLGRWNDEWEAVTVVSGPSATTGR